ncbi:bifunctional 3'-5' exonuclease/DNA polymerase [Leucobacter tardus]|uniref:DNA-directed DNA polymerase n=1 Tax=Leucobacter tardus TaxID=501483 RepID=A0A939TTD2_9MICO|nr:bifunctional 3'-5' exonuclease/DNA polymerase [Leucobacter tardus]MBO2988560.1 bifunctional 3'-5' exonuclease/DNA polymerase [Leucobacter tardus]
MLGTVAGGGIGAVDVGSDGATGEPVELTLDALPDYVRAQEASHAPRWVWSDSAHWLPGLLTSGVTVARCHDLRLCHGILARSAYTGDRAPLVTAEEWRRAVEEPVVASPTATLFDLEIEHADRATVPADLPAALAEFARQRAALDSSGADGRRLRILLAAESAGALIAAEMRSAGLPWSAEEHDRLLSEALGPRPASGMKPAGMVALAERIEGALGVRGLSIDSAPKLLQALRGAGIDVQSTSQWELIEHEHPAIAPLLQYKKLARLLAANGWSWIDEWVRNDRYRPVYVPGGVVTGRWASSGGGALQIPRRLRPAIRADAGWTFVSADVAQLEPRVLAAMSGDRAMAIAGQGKDLYAGIVESGAVPSRQDAKIAVLGAMYGSTSGDAGRLVPRLRRIYPHAMRLVDDAAATGERGGIVSTWLGRSSPAPDPEWFDLQARAQANAATAADESRARRASRDHGRFTRNFIVQGTAAEWALAWMADLRLRLARFPETSGDRAPASGSAFERRAHLAFFLHDEVIIHAPLDQAEAAATAIRDATAAAGRLLFGDAPVEFALDVVIGRTATKE